MNDSHQEPPESAVFVFEHRVPRRIPQELIDEFHRFQLDVEAKEPSR